MTLVPFANRYWLFVSVVPPFILHLAVFILYPLRQLILDSFSNPSCISISIYSSSISGILFKSISHLVYDSIRSLLSIPTSSSLRLHQPAFSVSISDLQVQHAISIHYHPGIILFSIPFQSLYNLFAIRYWLYQRSFSNLFSFFTLIGLRQQYLYLSHSSFYSICSSSPSSLYQLSFSNPAVSFSVSSGLSIQSSSSPVSHLLPSLSNLSAIF